MELQNAIYLTLLHSLWMGLILALATGIVILATKRSRAAMRYNLLTALLVVFVVGVAFVFYQSLTDKADGITISNAQVADQSMDEGGNSIISETQNNPILANFNSIVSLWSSYSGQIVLIWFLIICARCIQLLIGLHSVYYLKRTQLFIAGKFWGTKVADLSQKLGIYKKVSIFQSGIARVPMIAGYFKPVILMPIGMLNGISIAEVEAILSHELAHLKRNDYLVNILQSIIEIVFFFNPGVLWISKLIREERENCCDDLALSCTESKHQYIKALISCQEFRANPTPYAMAITGKKNQLKERVSRMLFENNSTLNKMEKTVLTLTLISALTITAAFNKIARATEHKSTGIAVTSNPFVTTGQPFCLIGEPMIEPDVSLLNTQITVPQDTSKKSHKKNTTSVKRTTITVNSNKSAEQQNENLDVAIDRAVASERDKANQAADRARHIEDAKAYATDAKAYATDMKAYATDMKAYEEDAKRYAADALKYAEDPDNYQAPTPPTAPRAPKAPKAPAAPKAPHAPSAPVAPQAPKAPSTSGMTTDLVKDGLLKDTKNFTYKMNAEELSINGVKQSEAIHRKYMEKYLKNKRGTITTTVQTD